MRIKKVILRFWAEHDIYKFIRQEIAPSKRPGDIDRLISDVGPSY